MPDYSAGGLLADQAMLPLNIHRGFISASMRHIDAATERQGDRYTDSIIEFHPAGRNRQCQKPVPTVRGRCSQKCSHLYEVRNGRLDHCPRCQDTRSVPEGNYLL